MIDLMVDTQLPAVFYPFLLDSASLILFFVSPLLVLHPTSWLLQQPQPSFFEDMQEFYQIPRLFQLTWY